jgi:hypothetical protein
MEFTAHSIEWGIFLFLFLVWVLLRVGKYLSDREKARKATNDIRDLITSQKLLNEKISEFINEVRNERNNKHE